MPLTVIIPKNELYFEEENRFHTVKETKLVLEHSLLSLHKWEQKWKVPYMKEGELEKTGKEGIIDYIRCMTINKPNDDMVYYVLPEKTIKEISDYINDPMTATWISDRNDNPNAKIKTKKRNKEIITSEIIYWQMITLQIPIEFEKWHLNSLLMLIQVCEVKNKEQQELSTKGKKTRKPNLKSRAALNSKRRLALNSKG